MPKEPRYKRSAPKAKRSWRSAGPLAIYLTLNGEPLNLLKDMAHSLQQYFWLKSSFIV
jgi:hypothetical protein